MTQKILILGGGISGLSAAFFTRKKYPKAKVTLLEKTARLGGWIQTDRDEGFLFERGPRTFAVERCPNLLELIREVGLEGDLLFSDPSQRRRFLWYEGKLRSSVSFFPKLLLSLMREPFIPKASDDDESIYAFASRRLGAFFANTLIDALALGIYAGDIHKLSIRSCFLFLSQWEERHGSLLFGAIISMLRNAFLSSHNKGRKGLFTLQQGMESLIEPLVRASRVEIHLGAAVEEIRQDGAIANGTFYPADLVISALGGSTIGSLTGLWSHFEEADIGIVHLAYQEEVLPRQGFGYLVPTQEGENLLGMIWDSAIFPNQSTSKKTRVSALMRIPSIDCALDCMRRHLGVSQVPVFTAERLAKAAIPQFHVGYAARLAHFENEVRKHYPSLILLGNYLRGASVEHCVSLAKKTFDSNNFY